MPGLVLASSNLTQLRLMEETSYGSAPVAGSPNNIRNTGDGLAFSITKKESDEIVSDRMTTDLIPVSAAANGPINFELSYKEFDTLLRAALCSLGWAYYGVQIAGVGQGVGTSFGATFSATTLTADVGPTTTSQFINLMKGQWFQVQCAGSVNDKKFFRTHPTTAPTATTITVDPATPFGVDAAAKPCKVSSARIMNGTNFTSFTIERQHIDVGQFFPFYGMALSKFSLSISSGAVITGSFEFMGKNGARGVATVLPGAPILSQTYDVMNAVVGVGKILENGVVLAGTKIKKLDLSVDNTLRGQDAIGEMGNASIGMGGFKVTGSMDIYLSDGTIYDKFISNVASSLQVPVLDSASNGYVFQLPKLKYGDAKVNSGSKDSDCMISVPFTGLKDPVSSAAFIIDRMGV